MTFKHIQSLDIVNFSAPVIYYQRFLLSMKLDLLRKLIIDYDRKKNANSVPFKVIMLVISKKSKADGSLIREPPFLFLDI